MPRKRHAGTIARVNDDLRDLLEKRFRVSTPSQDKTATLSDAVRRLVRPGDALHLGATHVRGAATPWEILRQFHGTTPAFELQTVSMTTALAPLVHCGLVSRIVTSWSGDAYYAPGPNPIYQDAYADGSVAFSHWSILTIPQRLAAGARGVEWTTTRSLYGSQMQHDNADDIREIEPGLLMIRALTPDLSMFHAPAADAAGNVLMTPPLLENVWGALAARRGALVTVERIVDADYVREHAHLVRIPSHAVAAVVPVPFGAHPGGVFTRGLPGIQGYGEDYPFWAALRATCRDPKALDAWIAEWILEPTDRAAYLKKIGDDRLKELVLQSDPSRVPQHVEDALARVDADAQCNAIEAGIVAGSRLLAERAEAGGLTHMLAGAGMANLAAWLAAVGMRDRDAHIDLVAEMGLVGYTPQAGEPFIFNHRNFPACSMLADIDTVMGVLMSGARARSIASLGGAQVDRHGNINTTMANGRFLMGSGGANDVATCATESVITTIQSRDRLVERVEYVTSPGDRVTAMATTHGTYIKDDGEFILTGVICPGAGDAQEGNGGSGADIQAAVREARARCGWDLRVARTVESIPTPTPVELRTLRLMDPAGYFRGT